MKYIYIFIGGAIGALLRWQISFIPVDSQFPIGTLLANLIGAMGMGYFTRLSTKWFIQHPQIKQGITTGFLGALTTFSTFQFELVYLAEYGHFLILLSYALISYCCGILCCFLGYRLGGYHK
ncbi:camphor resistance protein CrcB [Staphylococcus schleiferi]|uniref:fluoride efflux transporter CrcB n=1 Tax=Staphylococcus coagulans TaxID=74706 RepID=UPI0006BDE202|nr:fluoride efflux transporter CrcB [Staphylococcus coagulans]MDR9832120.1 fluoride efflux transporter CrcB [Staphylococcus coagulans]PNZ09289.1 fluoride efflux transporter CrcB [Staphylococcus coagulans]BAS45793.1 camphor resistance protein CrcB [Staphylococcus schleiferi]